MTANHVQIHRLHLKLRNVPRNVIVLVNLWGRGGSPPIWNSLYFIIHPDQEIHPVLPYQHARSGNQKQYSCGRLHCNSILMDSTASIMLMFNGDLLDTISTLHNLKIIHAGGGNFEANQTGSLTKALHHLPLPKDGYHFHPDAVANLVSMAVVSDHHCGNGCRFQ